VRQCVLTRPDDGYTVRFGHRGDLPRRPVGLAGLLELVAVGDSFGVCGVLSREITRDDEVAAWRERFGAGQE
jgi:hypothetical protein